MERNGTLAPVTAEQRVALKTEQTRVDVGPTVALIPAYNEERFIGSIVLAVRQYVDMVVVVDDGSRDRTADIAQRAGATVVRHRINQGKAAGVNTGFQYIRQLNPSALVMLDGDGQHSADDIPSVLEPVQSGEADIVVGSRFLEVKSEIPLYRQVGQHGLTLMTNLTSGVKISDSQSGFRAFSARAVQLLTFRQGGFSIESEMQFLIRDHGLRVIERPIKVLYAEPAKRSPVRHGMQVVNGILRLVGQTRPLLFFGGSGLSMIISAFVAGLYVIDIYTQTQQPALGYALLTVLMGVVGVVLCFAGIILHSTRGLIVDLRTSLLERIAAERTDVQIRRPQEDQGLEELELEVGR